VQSTIYIATIVAAYLLGAIPFGFLAGKARGVDIRKEGSGNIGATNVLRILGKPAGITVLLLDACKGYVAVAWLTVWLVQLLGLDEVPWEGLRIIAGLAVVLGHNYTCWLRFKGGKGIATSAGVLVALVPWSLLIIFVVWIVLTVSTRYVSLGSIAASFTLPFASWATGDSLTSILVTGGRGVLAIYKHRANIQRLLQGKESRLGSGKKKETS
jgi:glycerol-3-phosphate acyltransferase PlsY